MSKIEKKNILARHKYNIERMKIFTNKNTNDYKNLIKILPPQNIISVVNSDELINPQIVKSTKPKKKS